MGGAGLGQRVHPAVNPFLGGARCGVRRLCGPVLAATVGALMKPVINLEEAIGKTVGRRTAPADAFAYGMALQKTGARLTKAFGHKGVPKGVYRFHSHEEADAWLMKQLIQNRRK